jgi:galactokinase
VGAGADRGARQAHRLRRRSLASGDARLRLPLACLADGRIEIVDASTGAICETSLTADVPHRQGHWSDYAISVARRIARDFPGARAGMRAVFSSSLPKGAGLSSSSALVVATFLPLAAFNRLEDHPTWPRSPGGLKPAGYDDSKDALAGYLGAIESGRAFGRFRADHGVGTQGGSEDHTAILCCRAGQLSLYRFRPIEHEGEVALPEGWTFAIAVSGVHASKSGAVREHLTRRFCVHASSSSRPSPSRSSPRS